MVDIHSHILPAVDDGAENLEESLALLEAMKNQGITDVMATPHFYPHEDSLPDFKERTALAYDELLKAAHGKELPRVYLGCEILYFNGLGFSEAIGELCLNGSQYLLIELTDEAIGNSLFKNIEYLKTNTEIVPIIAHVERYYRSKNYRKFIKFIEQENITVQINASSFLEKIYDKAISKLIKSNIEIVIGSDTHSLEERPPVMDKALAFIEKKYGKACVGTILRNTDILFKKIVSDGEF